MEYPVNLAAWGFTEQLSALAAADPELTAGRVVSQEKGRYRVIHAEGEQSAAVSGRFRFQAKRPSDYPAVGDFVLLDTATGDGQALIHAVLPRRSVFIRRAAGTAQAEQVVAANVDTVFLCMALNNDFNLRRMERYLSLAWDSGATPVVMLTKADLCGDLEEKKRAVEEIAVGAELLVTSAREQDGHAELTPYLAAGKTVAFVGSSGVGKSTMINRLLGREELATNGLRNDDRGRHTTTRRELLRLPGGALVMDTPGMREVGLWDAADGLETAFSDIEALAARCRFSDCLHENEPGCAVCAALAAGELTQERWRSYQKLRAENAYSQSAGEYLCAKEKKFKDIARINRAAQGKRKR